MSGRPSERGARRGRAACAGLGRGGGQECTGLCGGRAVRGQSGPQSWEGQGTRPAGRGRVPRAALRVALSGVSAAAAGSRRGAISSHDVTRPCEEAAVGRGAAGGNATRGRRVFGERAAEGDRGRGKSWREGAAGGGVGAGQSWREGPKARGWRQEAGPSLRDGGGAEGGAELGGRPYIGGGASSYGGGRGKPGKVVCWGRGGAKRVGRGKVGGKAQAEVGV